MQLPVHLLSVPALAESVQEAGRLGGTQGPDLTRYFLICVVLIAATAGVTWGLKRLLAHNLQTRAAKRSLQVLDVLGLGGKRQVAVVRCYDRTFLLGLGEREVSSIAELDAVVAADRPTEAPGRADQAAFAHTLERFRGALPGAESAAAEVPALPQDSIDPALHAELERQHAEAAQEQNTTQPRPTGPESGEPKRTRLVRRKVARRRSKAADGERAQSVASAALEMAESMKRERAAGTAEPATPKGPSPSAGDEPPRPRLEGVLG